MPTVVFAAGGSGGHLAPAIAVAEALLDLYESQLRVPSREPLRIVFATSDRAIDAVVLRSLSPALAQVCEQRQLAFPSARDCCRRPGNSWPTAWRAFRAARSWLNSNDRQVVIGCGGQNSVPVLAAAVSSRGIRTLDVPILLLEQNAVPGRATTMFARFADAVCLSFPAARHWFSPGIATPLTGNPVRAAIAALANQSRPVLPEHDRSGTDRPQLLITGGSQGATHLNDSLVALAGTAPHLLATWRIVHQTGGGESGRVEAAYRQAGIVASVHDFIDDMSAVLSTTDLAITRAGATTLAELACAGVPAIMIPYPGSVRDHQRHNAAHFADQHAGWQLNQQSDPQKTAHQLQELLLQATPEVRSAARIALHALACPSAAQIVATMILSRL